MRLPKTLEICARGTRFAMVRVPVEWLEKETTMTNSEALTHLRQLATELADGPRKKALELCLTWVGPFEGMVELRSKLAATTLEVEKARDARDAAEAALVDEKLQEKPKDLVVRLRLDAAARAEVAAGVAALILGES